MHPSAPALAKVCSSVQATAEMPPGPTLLRAICFVFGLMLHSNTLVSREPEAKCFPSGVQAREKIRAVWKLWALISD